MKSNIFGQTECERVTDAALVRFECCECGATPVAFSYAIGGGYAFACEECFEEGVQMGIACEAKS